MGSGKLCGSPRMNDKSYCHYHCRLHESFLLPGNRYYEPPPLTDAHNIQLALHHVYRAQASVQPIVAGGHDAGKDLGKDLRARTDTLQWLFWQMGGLGPMAGQNNHFSAYAPEKIPYAIDRYRNEVNRLFGVMNKRLADRNYLGGDYSIADMACYPWVLPWERQGQNIEDFPHLKRWLEAIKARPAVVKAYEWTPKINPGAGGIRTAEERAILFGQTARSISDAAAAKQ